MQASNIINDLLINDVDRKLFLNVKCTYIIAYFLDGDPCYTALYKLTKEHVNIFLLNNKYIAGIYIKNTVHLLITVIYLQTCTTLYKNIANILK